MTDDALLGPAQVRDLAGRLGVRPTKSRGQNFVVDAGTIRRIVRVAEVRAGEHVVEVGPGLGSLTLGLLEAGARVTAIEIDPLLARALPETVAAVAPGAADRLTVRTQDALAVTELPGDPQHRPLWRPFASGAVGALVLLPAGDSEPLLVELARVLRLPLVICGPRDAPVPPVLSDARGIAFEGSDAAEGLRALLAGAGLRGAA